MSKTFIRCALTCATLSLAAHILLADVALVERKALGQQLARKEQAKEAHGHQAAKRAGAAKAKPIVSPATGSQALIDSSGLEFFINTNIAFITSSSASGAVSEASYTGPVAATTSGSGTVSSTLTDAFDGYNGLCLSTTGATGPCDTGDPVNYTIYSNNGPATTECGGRQIVLPTQAIGALAVQRKVLVPSDDAFARWMNLVTNNGLTPQTVTLITSNNLGSDNNTIIDSSSSGNAAAETGDLWVTTYQDYVSAQSTDPRLGHVLQGPGAPTTLANVVFPPPGPTAGLPFWAYTFTLAPGETRNIVNFVTGQPSRAAARAKAAALADFTGTARQCMSPAELRAVTNFATLANIPTLDTLGLAALAVGVLVAALLLLRRRAQALAV